jgi:hypothetical protein
MLSFLRTLVGERLKTGNVTKSVRLLPVEDFPTLCGYDCHMRIVTACKTSVYDQGLLMIFAKNSSEVTFLWNCSF